MRQGKHRHRQYHKKKNGIQQNTSLQARRQSTVTYYNREIAMTNQDMIDDYRRQLGEINKEIDRLNNEINGVQSRYNKKYHRLKLLINLRRNVLYSMYEMQNGETKGWH